MRLVLDTNIVVSGLLWNGTPAQLIESKHSHRHRGRCGKYVRGGRSALAKAGVTRHSNIIHQTPPPGKLTLNSGDSLACYRGLFVERRV